MVGGLRRTQWGWGYRGAVTLYPRWALWEHCKAGLTVLGLGYDLLKEPKANSNRAERGTGVASKNAVCKGLLRRRHSSAESLSLPAAGMTCLAPSLYLLCIVAFLFCMDAVG